ncbi:hypothetical protein Tco_1362547 [Tanacetum coccineum]
MTNVSVLCSTRTKPATESRKNLCPEEPHSEHRICQLGDQLERIMEPIVEPLELTPSVSSSSKVTMISRSKGRTVADSIAERLTRPTAYKFKTDCSIIPVWCVSIRTSGLEIGETLGNLILRLLEETVVRAGKPVKKVLLMNLSDHRCSIHTVIIDPHGIRANDDSKYPMQDMLISLLTYLKKSRKFTYKASAQSLKINVFFKSRLKIRRRYIIKAFQIPTDMSM